MCTSSFTVSVLDTPRKPLVPEQDRIQCRTIPPPSTQRDLSDPR